MPPKRRPRTVSVPTPDKVAAAVRRGDFAAAVDLARTLAEWQPTAEHAALYRSTLLQAAEHYDRLDVPADSRRVLDTAVGLNHPDPDWLKAVAVLLAKAGHRTEAETLFPDAGHAGHFADWLVRTKAADQVPPEWKGGYDAITSAFAHYKAGRDEPAREALNAVGLSSPFLDWKLLLRGLIAWSGNDDAKAVENFARLNPARLPHRLAAPVRVGCDPAFAGTLAEKERAAVVQQGKDVRQVGAVAKLARVRAELARGRKLTAAFKAAESAAAELKKSAPHIVPKLADCFYFAIIRRGEQDDLARHRKLFGPPPTDPQFHKLEALVFEEIEQHEMALRRWAAYEGWLAGDGSGWPKAMADRARAVVLRRMAGVAQDIDLEGDAPDLAGDLEAFFAPARKGKGRTKSKAPPPNPVDYLKRAADLAPDWEQAAKELFQAATDYDDPATAEAAARRYLTHNPKSLFTLSSLAGLLAARGDTAEALELRRRALAVNPLDAANRHAAGGGTVAHARRLGMSKPADAEKLLSEAEQLLEATVPTSLHALRSALFRKLKRPDDADREAERAFAGHNARLVGRLYLHANAVLLKLKPAERKLAADAYTAALAEPPTPGEAASLLAGAEMLTAEGLTYTGQKTGEKKILDALVRALPSPAGSELEFESVAALLLNRKQLPLALKAAAALMKRFPKNPLFPLVAAQAEFARGKGRGGYKVTEPLRKARVLAEASTEERHKQLLPQIDELLKAADPWAGVFGSFFG